MEYVYAAMLLHKAGKEINEKNLSEVLTAAGVKADSVRTKALVASLAEVDIDEAIKTAPTMMAAAPEPEPAAPAKEEKPPTEKKDRNGHLNGLSHCHPSLGLHSFSVMDSDLPFHTIIRIGRQSPSRWNFLSSLGTPLSLNVIFWRIGMVEKNEIVKYLNWIIGRLE